MGLFGNFFSKSKPSPAIQENEEEGVMTIQKGTYEYEKQHTPLKQSGRVLDNEDGKYTSIPSVPMGGNSKVASKIEPEIEHNPKNGLSQMANNPAVIVGMGATALALLAMFGTSLSGDKVRMQKLMQKRVIAQFVTVSALIAGAAYLVSKPNGQKEKPSDSMLHKH